MFSFNLCFYLNTVFNVLRFFVLVCLVEPRGLGPVDTGIACAGGFTRKSCGRGAGPTALCRGFFFEKKSF